MRNEKSETKGESVKGEDKIASKATTGCEKVEKYKSDNALFSQEDREGRRSMRYSLSLSYQEESDRWFEDISIAWTAYSPP